jgi:hypothetical protein
VTSIVTLQMRHVTPAAVEAVRKGEPIPSGTVITMVEHKAQLDAQGNPFKDANGRFVKGELNGSGPNDRLQTPARARLNVV